MATAPIMGNHNIKFYCGKCKLATYYGVPHLVDDRADRANYMQQFRKANPPPPGFEHLTSFVTAQKAHIETLELRDRAMALKRIWVAVGNNVPNVDDYITIHAKADEYTEAGKYDAVMATWMAIYEHTDRTTYDDIVKEATS